MFLNLQSLLIISLLYLYHHYMLLYILVYNLHNLDNLYLNNLINNLLFYNFVVYMQDVMVYYLQENLLNLLNLCLLKVSQFPNYLNKLLNVLELFLLILVLMNLVELLHFQVIFLQFPFDLYMLHKIML